MEYTTCILTGKRYTAAEGKRTGIIHETVPGDQLMERALELGGEIAKADLDRETMRELKNGLNQSAIVTLNKPHTPYPKL